jgi:CRISPR-associated endonuclease Cas2
MNHKNIFLVTYDISNDKKRNKIAKLLEQNGYERIQYSVFTGITSPRNNLELWKQLQKIADTGICPENKILSFAVPQTTFLAMKTIGTFNADMEYLLGIKHTEII